MGKVFRGIGRFFAVLFTVLLTLLLICQLTYIIGVVSIRQAFTPANVYNYMNSINYAELELPDGNGGTSSMAEAANRELGEIGLEISPAEVNSFIMLFSVDDIAASFAQDMRAWLLDFAPEPRLDAREITDMILSGLDSQSYSFMKIFGDPEEMLYTLVSGITSGIDMHEVLEPLENIRHALSLGTLSLAASGALFVFLLILIIKRKNVPKAGLLLSLSAIVASAGALAACFVARMNKSAIISYAGLTESLYDIVYIPCDKYLTRNSKLALMGSAAVFAIFGVSLIIIGMIDRARNKKAEREAAENRGGTAIGTPDGYAVRDNTAPADVPVPQPQTRDIPESVNGLPSDNGGVAPATENTPAPEPENAAENTPEPENAPNISPENATEDAPVQANEPETRP